jgi:hypothetical protein
VSGALFVLCRDSAEYFFASARPRSMRDLDSPNVRRLLLTLRENSKSALTRQTSDNP